MNLPRLLALTALLAALPGCGNPTAAITSDVDSSDPAPSPTPAPVPVTRYFAYVTNYQSGNVSSFQLDPATGSPTSTGLVPASPSNYGTEGIVADASGEFIHVSNYVYWTLYSYAVDPHTGQLSTPSTVSSSLQSFHYPDLDPSGQYLYVPLTAGNAIQLFNVDNLTGYMTQGTSVAAVTGPTQITISGQRLFALTPSAVYSYKINASAGTLTAVNAVTGLSNATWAKADPAGTHLYVTQASAISIYSINSTTGALSPAGSVSVTTPGTSAFSPDGSHAYFSIPSQNLIQIYSVDSSSGALNAAGSASLAASSSPGGLAIAPDGKFLVSANGGNNTVSAFTVDASSGALASAGTIPTGGTAPLRAAILKVTAP